MENDQDIIEAAQDLQKFQLQLSGNSDTYAKLLAEIASQINYLITSDFSLLVSILYRLDISEKKLKYLLNLSKKTTAGDIIATMIIERQLQKVQSRRTYKMDEPDIPDNDKW